MRCCLAQTNPSIGNIEDNMARHLAFIRAAVSASADSIFFPELSLTGYEPSLAGQLAIHSADERLNAFQEISDTCHITIGMGAPIKKENGINIGMLVFQPATARAVYAKQYLHPDEEPYFVAGEKKSMILHNGMALAICYELSVPAHAERVFQNGAALYMASVAKTVDGVIKAEERLAVIARTYAAPVLMVNSVGLQDGMACTGRSAIWDHRGELIHQLNDTGEGLLLFCISGETATGQSL